MHRLLTRQLKRFLHPALAADERLAPFLEAIDRHYHEVEQERRLLENALAVCSDELSEVIAKAQREHALLRGVMDSIPDLIFFKSADGRYLGCNKAYERQMRMTEAEVLDKTDADILDGQLAVEFGERDREVLGTGQEHLSERWFHGRDEKRKVCLEVLRTPYFDLDGQMLGLIGIGRDITERKLAAEAILRQANFDSLTELPNRRYYNERLLGELKAAKRSKLATALMLIDLDKFKQVNDVLGHDVGDLLLVEVARRLVACVREIDIVARLGGDEFVVVVTGLQQFSLVDRIAQKIIDRLAAPFNLGGEIVSISGSIGIALYPRDAQHVDALTKKADQAMYLAKSAGRNRYSHCTEVPLDTPD